MRGFGARERCNQLLDYIIHDQIDIIYLQETMKQSFSFSDLCSIVGNTHFSWGLVPSSGHSGGILVGTKDDAVEITSITIGHFFVSIAMIQKDNMFSWELLNVSGPADHDLSMEFLSEIETKIASSSIPGIKIITSFTGLALSPLTIPLTA